MKKILLKSLILCALPLLTATYLIILYCHQNKTALESTFGWQPPATITTILLDLALIGLIIGIQLSCLLNWDDWKKNRKTFLPKLAAAGLSLYFFSALLLNSLSWKHVQPTILAVETLKETATPEEAAAGKAYLQAVKAPVDPTLFQKTLTPYLTQEKWAFIEEDPSLYAHQSGEKETWAYLLPAGNAHHNLLALLGLAEKDIQKNNPTAAAQKVELILGIGNRVSDHPQIIAVCIGNLFIEKGLDFLETHPELLKTPGVQKELARTRTLPQNLADAIEQEYLTVQKYLEKIALRNGTPTPASSLINADSWRAYHQNQLKVQKEENPNWERFHRNQRLKAYCTGQLAARAFLGVGMPDPSISKHVSQLMDRVKNLTSKDHQTAYAWHQNRTT